MDIDSLAGRPTSPSPSVDFSIIDVDLDDPEVQFSTNTPIPGAYPIGRRAMSGMGSRRTTFASSSSGWPATASTTSIYQTPAESSHNPFKGTLSRIWDVISSPGRAVLNFTPSPSLSAPPRTPSPPPRLGSWYLAEQPSIPSRTKGKARAFFSRNGSRSELHDFINYSDLAPLDGEEGELIDDEACFIDVRAITGIDILALLPPEVALHILIMLCPSPPSHSSPRTSRPLRTSHALSVDTEQNAARHAILACRAVSHTWRRLASDNAVWRALFLSRWGIDLRRAGPELSDPPLSTLRSLGLTWSFEWGSNRGSSYGGTQSRGSKSMKGRFIPFASPRTSSNLKHSQTRSDYSHYYSSHRISYIRPPPASASPLSAAPLQLDWRLLYRERLELERRWAGTVPGTVPSRTFSRPPLAPDLLGLFDLATDDQEMEMKENIRPWEPVIRKMEGHTDSVYCVEFDSQYVVTGSRDRTIKVWSLKTGQVLGTFQDAHRGSVLCLKFEKDWALGADSMEAPPKGLLVSGSSDCSICVWEMELGDLLPNGEREITAKVLATLEGHEGGVLDIRMDDKWIVSCSKDASIRVWDRKTLTLSRVLRGHEGPVNAIGLQHDRVVSASGDGKLILWDTTNGERIRTFEGHDRGLACIEFKDNFIVSGSNDDKIKVWDPWTGECLRTLTGHNGLVRALSFDPRTGRLVSVSYDKTVKVWDFRTGKCLRDFGQVHGSHIFDVKFDATRIVTASHDHKIAELDFSVGLDASLFI
ncbi:hypothetical protein EST38_g10472 [Candolleomyces aberdarensis]|uniref:F-box domain-containing protein n=1 Tax=Candolleomyces aberdarensis TaxID=2316362 RepID=A0A4Q2D7B0_9AGAR|nr:hypothetical protein EST38_g10472 [Candolleomyces aberdarensis]